MLTSTLLLASLLLGQEPAPRFVPPPYDFVVGVAGNEVVLRTDLDVMIHENSELKQRYERARTQKERLEVQLDSLSALLEQLVMVQAGSDIGFDPELVEQLTNREFKRQIERQGGYRAMSAALAEQGMTPARLKELNRDRLLSESWRRSRIGRAPGPTGRVTVDRYIRPGLLRMYYDAFVDSRVQAEREAVGQVDPQVRIQLLQINVPPGEDRDRVLRNIQALVDTYQSGDTTFEALVNQYGDESVRNLRGVAPAPVLDRLGQLRHSSPELGELAREGEVGAVTRPLWLEITDGEGRVRTQAWCVYRLAERIPAVPALPFESRELQAKLRAYLLKILDEEREDAAFAATLADTYIWPEQYRRTIMESRAERRSR